MRMELIQPFINAADAVFAEYERREVARRHTRGF